MKALVLNALSRGFDFEDVEIAAPIWREVLVDVQASGLCHEVAGIVTAIGPDVTLFRVGDHGTDLERARPMASQIRAGRVVINNMMDDPQAPWGDSNTQA